MVPRRYRVLLWAVPVLVVHWILIAAIPLGGPNGYEYVTIGFLLGSLFGQTALAAAWTALGPGPVVGRILLSLAWVFMLPVLIAINLGTHDGPIVGAVVIGACVFGQWLLLQMPLWALDVVFGLRLRHEDDWGKIQDQREWQFSLRHLLVITAILGVVFGAGRILASRYGDSLFPDREAPTFIFLVVAAVILTLPLLLAGLLPRWDMPAVVLVFTLFGLVAAWEVTLLQQVAGVAGLEPDKDDFMWMNLFTAATILAGVLLFRLNGYSSAKI